MLFTLPGMTRAKAPWAFALIYTALSMATEIVLIVVFHLKIPRHNAIIAPIILTFPPLLAAWIAGRQSRRELVILAALTAVLTVIVTGTVTRFTGVSTGLLEPLINRPVAGFLAIVIANALRKKPV
ncbi:MAG: hypothetical protein WCS99_15375 [Limisphaerales bacterium]